MRRHHRVHAFFERAMIASASALTCAVVKFHCSRCGAASSDARRVAVDLLAASTHTSHAFSGGGPSLSR